MAFKKIAGSISEKNLAITLELIHSLKIQREEIDDQISTLEDSIKNEMSIRGVDSLCAGNYKATWTSYTTHRFDTKAFKAEYEDLYNSYNKEVEARRFVVK